LTIVVLPLLLVAFAACGGGSEEKATQTPAEPAAATPTQVAEATPVGPTFSGSATATVTVGGQSFTFKNGRCDKGPDDAWLLVSIGRPAGDEYFGLLAGADPTAPEAMKPAKGGGEFTGQECGSLSATFGGNTFVRALDAECKLTLDADLEGGEFVGTTTEGEPVSGSFKC
jgi:hypothetical protein